MFIRWKVAGSLLEKKPQETLEYLRGRQGMVDHFIAHMGSSAVMDLLLKIISCEEDGGKTLQWLCGNNLIKKLVEKFSSGNADMHEHVGE